MSLVNELHISQGLQSYTVDPGDTAYVQKHYEYQARTGISTEGFGTTLVLRNNRFSNVVNRLYSPQFI